LADEPTGGPDEHGRDDRSDEPLEPEASPGQAFRAAEALNKSLRRMDDALTGASAAREAMAGILKLSQIDTSAIGELLRNQPMIAIPEFPELAGPPLIPAITAPAGIGRQLEATEQLRDGVSGLNQLVAGLAEEMTAVAGVAVGAAAEVKQLRQNTEAALEESRLLRDTLKSGQSSADNTAGVLVRLTWAIGAMTLVLVVLTVWQFTHPSGH
jgi:hypothetical protein